MEKLQKKYNIMDVSFFAYTRTCNTDFHVLYQPRDKDSMEVICEFTRIAEELVGNYDIYNTSSKPQWVYLKSKELLFWGVVCANSRLGKNYTDRLGRPVRGCFGIILDKKSYARKHLPYDLNFFSTLYTQTVDTNWETRSYESTEYIFDINKINCQSIISYDDLFNQDLLNKNIIVLDVNCNFTENYNNEILRKEKFESTIENNVDDNHMNKIFIKVVACIILVFMLFVINSGLKSPEKRPISPDGYPYCIYCDGTGYEYNYFWGIFSKICTECCGSGYLQNKSTIIFKAATNEEIGKKSNNNNPFHNYTFRKND